MIPSAVLASLCLLAPVSVAAQQPSSPAESVTWSATTDYFGTPVYWTLHLEEHAGKLTGDLTGDKLEGTREGKHIHFLASDPEGESEEVDATVEGDRMSGTVTLIPSQSPGQRSTRKFTAVRFVAAPSAPPRRHDFVPTTFFRQFSAANPPVLRVNPGDTIHTTTVDAAGFDENHVHRVAGGNPQTGPFYIETALPGDTLVVHIVRLRLNRDTAISDDALVGRALNSGLAVSMKDVGKNVTWHLDRERGVATSEKPGDHLKPYTVPLKPMLGCIAAAPGPGNAPPTGDSGSWGGNMDFNQAVEGVTVLLPVSNPGALLYFGDGHAAQGDGELNGNALETSMDVEVKVDVIRGRTASGPRLISDTHIMAMGLEGSLDEAFRRATSNMARWLQTEYKLTPSEIAQVLGTSAEYRISEVADRNAGVVLLLRKDRLVAIAPPAGSTPAKPDPSVPQINH